MMRRYKIKELFVTRQGEGFHAGRAAVFCRFSGCNLWSGAQQTRASSICRFCDTDFVGTDGTNGGIFDADDLAHTALALWQRNHPHDTEPFIVCTGGEPLLQLDSCLIDALHQKQFFIATETNGTLPAPPDIDWLTVSPKAGSRLVQRHGDELKIVMPQEHWSWRDCQKIRERGHFRHCFIQPNDDGRQLRHMAHIMTYCNRHPSWRMSLQLHKLWNIP